jgi:hypothetical protein
MYRVFVICASPINLLLLISLLYGYCVDNTWLLLTLYCKSENNMWSNCFICLVLDIGEHRQSWPSYFLLWGVGGGAFVRSSISEIVGSILTADRWHLCIPVSSRHRECWLGGLHEISPETTVPFTYITILAPLESLRGCLYEPYVKG